MSRKKNNTISCNDYRLLSCTIDSNALPYKILRAQTLANDIREVDLIMLDNKTLVRQIRQLQKTLNKAQQLSEKISATFYNI